MRPAALRLSELRAVELLCAQEMTSIFELAHPALTRFRLPVTVCFESFGSFCQKTGADRAVFPRHSGADGLTVRHNGTYLVLYDEQVDSERRRAFTLAHEIGHILLAHEGGADHIAEEKEANAFAASLLAPEAAVRYLSHRDACPIDEPLLTSAFFLSHEAAKNRIATLARSRQHRLAACEITLLFQLFGKI